VPLEQAVQLVAAALPYQPAGHDVQLDTLDDAAYQPARQSKHAVAPVALANVPATH
jgi:hypothetical protein